MSNDNDKTIRLVSLDLKNILGVEDLSPNSTPIFPVDIYGGRHTMFVYCDLIQDKILGNTFTSLLRTVALIANTEDEENRKGSIISYRSFSNLQWKTVVKSSFQSISITLRDETRQLMPFLSVGCSNWYSNSRRRRQPPSSPWRTSSSIWIRSSRAWSTCGTSWEMCSTIIEKVCFTIGQKLGKNLVTAAIPEIGQVIAGKKKIRTAAKDSVKKSISESLVVAQPSNKPAGAARWVSGPQRGRPAQKARPVPPERVALPRLGSVKKRHDGKALSAPAGTKTAGSRKRKNAASSVTSTKKPTKRSRSEIFSNIKYY